MLSKPRVVRLTAAMLVMGLVLWLQSKRANADRVAGVERDSAGISILDNAPIDRPPDLDGWEITEVVRIGSEEDESYRFAEVSDIGIGPAGDIYVADQGNSVIRVYDSSGVYLRTVGGVGEGPGEFGTAIPGFGFFADTLLVFNPDRQRIDRFDRDGRYLGSLPIPFDMGIPLRIQFVSDGTIVLQLRSMPGVSVAGSEGRSDLLTVRGSDGVLVDTLLLFPPGETFKTSGYVFFSPEPKWDILQDGRIAYGRTDEYSISIFGPGGALERRFNRDVPALPVSRSTKERLLDMLVEGAASAGVPSQAIERYRQLVSFADHFPVFTEIKSGPEGTIWIQRPLPEDRLTGEFAIGFDPLNLIGSSEWDVFDSRGALMGQISLPRGFTLYGFEKNIALGVFRDDLEVQHIVALRVVTT